MCNNPDTTTSGTIVVRQVCVPLHPWCPHPPRLTCMQSTGSRASGRSDLFAKNRTGHGLSCMSLWERTIASSSWGMGGERWLGGWVRGRGGGGRSEIDRTWQLQTHTHTYTRTIPHTHTRTIPHTRQCFPSLLVFTLRPSPLSPCIRPCGCGRSYR